MASDQMIRGATSQLVAMLRLCVRVAIDSHTPSLPCYILSVMLTVVGRTCSAVRPFHHASVSVLATSLMICLLTKFMLLFTDLFDFDTYI